MEEHLLQMVQSPIWLAYILDEAQGRNLAQTRHGGDPFGNGPISDLEMRTRAALCIRTAMEETLLEMAQSLIWLAYTLDEAQGRNLGQARHGGYPFGNGPLSYLARLYIR